MSSAEIDEIARLRAEVRQLQAERAGWQQKAVGLQSERQHIADRLGRAYPEHERPADIMGHLLALIEERDSLLRILRRGDELGEVAGRAVQIVADDIQREAMQAIMEGVQNPTPSPIPGGVASYGERAFEPDTLKPGPIPPRRR